ncbi:MAG: ASCH domain-containing protein [Nocardioides sp.]
MSEHEVGAFWELARVHARLNSAPSYFGPTTLEVVPPPAGSFGDSAEQADELLALVLDGSKTATASALRDYESDEEPLPETGSLSILLDGAGHPQALIEVTDVRVVPFDEVDEEFARLEGEGDLSLGYWRDEHRRFFTSVGSTEFDDGMSVVLEQFRVVYRSDSARS